ncbi:single-stranded DNA-binding protein [Companilactobacillus sp. DQM5]|uniref:single-stranded DNA-binding protein n=1 Tax=Companilactobacillus sp. DQM5 TaxID=3463359 RepID=UPI004057D117
MINRVVLVGRLTRDPDLRYTANGAAVASFTIAVNRQFTNQQGEREADFINCVIWRKAAENFANFTKKGSLVGIDGRLQSRSYENQQGQRVYVTEVVVDNFSLLESKSATENRPSSAPNNNNNSYNNVSNNGNENNNNDNAFDAKADPFADNSQPIDISDDDLPF